VVWIQYKKKLTWSVTLDSKKPEGSSHWHILQSVNSGCLSYLSSCFKRNKPLPMNNVNLIIYNRMFREESSHTCIHPTMFIYCPEKWACFLLKCCLLQLPPSTQSVLSCNFPSCNNLKFKCILLRSSKKHQMLIWKKGEWEIKLSQVCIILCKTRDPRNKMHKHYKFVLYFSRQCVHRILYNNLLRSEITLENK